MYFLTTQPEALTYAAGKLQTLGSAMADESVAAAAPTTGVVPAAADEISALQATIFTAYGTLYQSINAQATAIHEMFVNTLGASAGSYGATESANSIATASQQVSGLFSAAANTAAADPPPGSALANIINIGTGNWDSAASDLLGMCGGSLLPATNETGEMSSIAAAPAGLDETAVTAAPAALAAPVLTGPGQAATVGALSAPPSWAAPAPGAGPVSTAGWTAPAPQGTPSPTTVPAAVPAMATAGKAAGLGAPRYGAKPTVMARPTGV
ncbi:PE family protein [Mycobacterium sp. 1245805.9]|uniref:PE family protein n=1 Tax=Mycobacterium sp. 1245805.9 TaxID=1856862 RepID=UPI0008019E9F|nr:PE family protein [Mycobacterium sp. 1245805.9]OBI85369.1 hypothetical protein A9X00_27995 [Mycobacterium sp. 1245805.9]